MTLNSSSHRVPSCLRRTSTALILAGLGLLASNVPVSFADNAAMVVTTAPARAATRTQYVQASGFVTPWDEASIDAEISGVPIVSAPVRVGDHVRKGQVLARFDTASLRARLAAAQAALAEAGADAIDAATKQERAQRLSSSDLLSKQQLLDITTHATMARARLQAARAALVQAQLDLSHAIVRAPDDGVISARTLTLGQVATAGTPLFRLIRENRLQWHAELTAEELAHVHQGMKVEISLPGKSQVSGKVREVAPSVSTKTQIGLAYADLNPNPAERAGLYTEGKIAIATHPVVLVPSQSIVILDGKTYAVSVNKGHAQLLPVTLAQQGSEETEVLKGVAAGTEMVTQGAGLLSDGEPVRVVPTAPAHR